MDFFTGVIVGVFCFRNKSNNTSEDYHINSLGIAFTLLSLSNLIILYSNVLTQQIISLCVKIEMVISCISVMVIVIALFTTPDSERIEMSLKRSILPGILFIITCYILTKT